MSERPPQRTPNRQLASLITEAGFSNAGLARRVDQLGLEHGLDLRYDKTSVTRWLRGQQPRGTTPALIAEVFTRRLGRRLSAQDLGLDACAPVYAGLEFAATPGEAVDIVSGLWRKDSGSHAELRKIAFTPAGLVVPSRDWLIGRADEWVARGNGEAAAPSGGTGGVRGTPGASMVGGARGAAGINGTRGAHGTHGLHGVNGQNGSAGPGGRSGARGPAPVRPPTGPLSSPAPPSAPPAHLAPPAPGAPGVPRQRQTDRGPGQKVSSGDVAALRSVGELFRTLDHTYGGGHARQALVRYLEHEAEPMLRGTYGEAIGRRLFSAAADLTRLAGWTSYDIAAHGLAQRYFVQALRLAQAAGDRVYGSYVLITMSRQAVYLGHGREAVQLARVAQQGVGSSAPPVVMALLHAVEARGHGVLGEARTCAASLARAEHALEAARPGDDVPHWGRYFDEAQLADEFGHCHRDLQQYRAAAQHAERSLQLRAPVYARSRLFCQVVLASARLGLGELDQACLLGAEAAQQAAEMRSVRAMEYVREFERRLEPYRDAAAVRGYRERVAALG
ncbi:collagen-like protein [Streptomyces sp. NBC_01762]|uniref:collagen-like triple helix repeat-containing protein n=1 Tax=unclassified Streptomyces TaxID=2593676 RepID=UPI002DDBAD8E|nr:MULTISPECIES: collagen-like protein [unclassified Streptomyces]WSC44696.1 collagen-like protein [Streptomyces sp. NBC_01762]WSD24283.1 collagen-like protein [Streptomyces sp. NBC_01751]